MKTVYCPVKNGNIDGGDCYIICDVADGYVKSTLLPDGLKWNEEQREKCINCKWHADSDQEKLFMVCDDTIDIGKEPFPVISEDIRRIMEKYIKELNK